MERFKKLLNNYISKIKIERVSKLQIKSLLTSIWSFTNMKRAFKILLLNKFSKINGKKINSLFEMEKFDTTRGSNCVKVSRTIVNRVFVPSLRYIRTAVKRENTRSIDLGSSWMQIAQYSRTFGTNGTRGRIIVRQWINLPSGGIR